MSGAPLGDPAAGPSAPLPPPPPGERGFRWRGSDGSRLEALGDAVFALSLTLLLLTADVPKRTSQLWGVLEEIVPFALTFAILGMIWFAHFLFFRRYGLRDRWCAFLNFVLLFLVLVYAYPLKLVFSLVAYWMFGLRHIDVANDDASFPLMEFYGIGFGAIYLVIALMYQHAWRNREELQLDAVERSVTRQYFWHALFMVAIAALSITIATFPGGDPLAGMTYFLVGPVTGFHAWWSAVRRERAGLA